LFRAFEYGGDATCMPLPEPGKAVHGVRGLELMRHQAQVVAAAAAGHRTFLLADEPGLGKTAQALLAAEAAHAFPLLVAAPNVVKGNWAHEAELCANCRQRLARNQLINRARVRYTGWKITRQAASDALRAASLTIGNANDLLTYWDAERDLNVHTLTEPQVVKAWKKGIMDRPTATERLSELGLATADIDTRLDES